MGFSSNAKSISRFTDNLVVDYNYYYIHKLIERDKAMTILSVYQALIVII